MGRTNTAALAAGVESLKGSVIATLHRFAQDLTGHHNLGELLRKALLTAARLTGSRHATVLLLDEQGERIRYRVALDNGNLAPLELVAKPMMSRGLAGWVARERQAALVLDTEQDPRWLPGPGLADLRSAIVAPLFSGERMLGMITLGHETPGHFVDEHLRLLEILCVPIALAVDQARIASILAGTPDAWLESAGVAPQSPLSQPAPSKAPSIVEIVALSVELRGLTSAAARLAPEALFRDVLEVYFQTMNKIIRRNEGTVDNIAGDTLLAIFYRPEQAPADAVRAALAMGAAAQRLCALWRTHLSISAGSLDIGIARGNAAIGDLGVEHYSSRAVGEVIGVAARLRDLARGGEILISNAVATGLDAGAFALEALQPLRLRDTAPQQIFRVGARQ